MSEKKKKDSGSVNTWTGLFALGYAKFKTREELAAEAKQRAPWEDLPCVLALKREYELESKVNLGMEEESTTKKNKL